MYLIYIGIKVCCQKYCYGNQEHKHQGCEDAYQGFMQGFLCNLLNPKAIMFILAFFTLIISPSTSWLEQFGFGLEIALIHFIWFSCLALMITHQRVRASLNKIQHYIIKLMGVVLIGFGARIASLSQTIS